MLNSENPQPVSENNPELENLREVGEIKLPEAVSKIYCLTIVGQIEGHQILNAQSKTTKYEHVIPQLVAVEQNPQIEGILTILNTAGGDVEAGLAIAELLCSSSKPTVSLVLGGGHSIGIPIAVSCRRSLISPTGTMTVHPIRYNGLVVYGYQQFEYLQKMQERINRFICEHTRITEDLLRQLMFKTDQLAQDTGTILVGQEAVDAGLIHQVGGLHEAFQALNEMISSKNDTILNSKNDTLLNSKNETLNYNDLEIPPLQ